MQQRPRHPLAPSPTRHASGARAALAPVAEAVAEATAVIADAEATPRIRVSYLLLTAELEAAEAELARLGGAAAAAEEKLRRERYARQREQVRSLGSTSSSSRR